MINTKTPHHSSHKPQGIELSGQDSAHDYGIVYDVKNFIDDAYMSHTADLLMFVASMDKLLGISGFDTWLDSLSTDIKTNTSFTETMIIANKVKWFLSAEQEKILITKAITDHVCPDIMVKAKTFYNILKDTQPPILLPEAKGFSMTPEVSEPFPFPYPSFAALFSFHTFTPYTKPLNTRRS